MTADTSVDIAVLCMADGVEVCNEHKEVKVQANK